MADYPNRTDLQNKATSTANFTGQTYGEASAQEASQQAVRPGSSPVEQQAQQVARQAPQPFNRPTERPDEPLTAGANFGPGPSAMDQKVRGRMIPSNDVFEQLMALYNVAPNDGLKSILVQMMEQRP